MESVTEGSAMAAERQRTPLLLYGGFHFLE
jgi:hypothetical protein